MHALMFWGFCALLLGTILATIDYDITLRLPLGLDFKLLQGPFYLVYELSLDLFGLFFVVGLGLALYRRFVVRPKRIDPTSHFAWILALLFAINVTGFVLEACRLAVVKPWWAPWSPVGWALGQVFVAVGMGEGALRGLHLGTWLFHFTISFGFIALIPHSYFVHLITTPLNTFLVKLTPQGELKPILNIEEAESLGVSKLEEFSWKRRLDFDACTMCGRCQDVCPAYLAGTPLSPKQVILKLRGLMHEGNGRRHPRRDDLGRGALGLHHLHGLRRGVPGVHRHVDTIVDLRRYLALSEGALPGNGRHEPPEHAAGRQPVGAGGRGAPRVGRGARRAPDQEGQEVEYLYWVGCPASYDGGTRASPGRS